MPITPNLETIALTNELVTQLQVIQQAVTALANIVNLNTAVPLANTWNNLATAPLKGDGTLGTADSNPVQTNPIDTRVYVQLNFALSSQQYQQLLLAAVNFLDVADGEAVAANGATPAVLAAIASVS
jgi:hypothetical protein